MKSARGTIVRLRSTKAFAVVDTDLWEALHLRRGDWRLDAKTAGRPRAYTPNSTGRFRGFPERLYLERLISNAPQGKFVRFKNFNTLDCRRANLEVVDWRSEVWREDVERRHQWETDEVAPNGRATANRLLVDAWRHWCHGKSLEASMRTLRRTREDVGAALLAMATDPLAWMV